VTMDDMTDACRRVKGEVGCKLEFQRRAS